MALIKCYECGKEISEDAPFCPQCGAPPKETKKKYSPESLKIRKNTKINVPIENPSFGDPTSTEFNLQEGELLLDAYKRRQKDTGWGYAFAHLVPFVSVWYAFNRKTIFPLLYTTVGGMIISLFAVGITSGSKNPYTAVPFAQVLGVFSTPFIVKAGIDKARKYAKNKMKKMNIKYYPSPKEEVRYQTQSNEKSSTSEPINIVAKPGEFEQKLNELKSLYDRGLITEKEYKALREKTLGI